MSPGSPSRCAAATLVEYWSARVTRSTEMPRVSSAAVTEGPTPEVSLFAPTINARDTPVRLRNSAASALRVPGGVVSTGAPSDPASGAATTASVQLRPETITTESSMPPASAATASATRSDVAYRSAPPYRETSIPACFCAAPAGAISIRELLATAIAAITIGILRCMLQPHLCSCAAIAALSVRFDDGDGVVDAVVSSDGDGVTLDVQRLRPRPAAGIASGSRCRCRWRT